MTSHRYLNADCNVDGDNEQSDRELVEDPHRAVDVPEYFFTKDRLDEDRQNSEDVEDVEDGDANDDRVHERSHVVRFPEMKQHF